MLSLVVALLLSSDRSYSPNTAMQNLFQPLPPASTADEGAAFRAFLDERAERIIRSATILEVVRFRSDPEHANFTAKAEDAEPQAAGFAIAYTVQVNDRKVLNAARKLSLSPESYRFLRGFKLCGGFQPKVAFRFWSGQGAAAEWADVLVCFNCDDVDVSAPRVEVRWDGEPIGPYGDISRSRQAWVKLAKRVLVNDEQIQSYRETSK